ncbi:hypothetical protein CPHO_02110 [Corynebacterium phocae]|uniref:Cutinase n=2 Tax=Corynebacterium phocae TaxID=161895 RepID=A0A1L7D1C9_9CORY|nr:hypothetical protein CPHO_02110 [Corynebacterium phocae]
MVGANTQVAQAQGEDPLSRQCADLEVVYARGSGQDVGNSAELQRLKTSLDMGTKNTNLTANLYELGSTNIGGTQYPAVGVKNLHGALAKVLSVGDQLIGAKWGVYYGSVDSGIDAAEYYINERAKKCGENSKFYLAGYSQGAHVFGETYAIRLSDDLRDRYPESGDFNVNVRAFGANGQVGSHSVPVHVDTTTGLPDLPEHATAVSVADVNGKAELKWEADSAPAGGWLVRADGIILGRMVPEAREATITDLPLSEDIAFGVAPISAEGYVGETVVAYLGQPTVIEEGNSSRNSSINVNGSSTEAQDEAEGSAGSSDSAGAMTAETVVALAAAFAAVAGAVVPILRAHRGFLRSLNLPSWFYRMFGL